MWKKDLVYFPHKEKISVLKDIGPYCVTDNGIWYEKDDEIFFYNALNFEKHINRMVKTKFTNIVKNFRNEPGYIGVSSIRIDSGKCTIKYLLNIKQTGYMVHYDILGDSGEQWSDEYVAEEKEYRFSIPSKSLW